MKIRSLALASVLARWCPGQSRRQWQGVEHTVTVLADGYEWRGRPYRSLSAIARAITGTRWNGWVFFGIKNQRGGA